MKTPHPGQLPDASFSSGAAHPSLVMDSTACCPFEALMAGRSDDAVNHTIRPACRPFEMLHRGQENSDDPVPTLQMAGRSDDALNHTLRPGIICRRRSVRANSVPGVLHGVCKSGANLRDRFRVHKAFRRAGLVWFLWSICLPCALPGNSQGDACASASHKLTALLVQKKGPESIIFETNVTTGGVTGLRKALKLHDHALSGVALDPLRQRLYLVTSAPSAVVHTVELRDEDVLYLGNASIFEEFRYGAEILPDTCSNKGDSGAICSNSSSSENQTRGHQSENRIVRRECKNVWNPVVWEASGLLLAMTPRDSGFNTSVLVIDPLTGQAQEKQVCQGSPVRGIYTFDRRGDKYYFLTTAKKQRNLASFYAPEGLLTVKSLFLHDELIGLHYDDIKCRLLAVALRSPGVLSVQSLTLSHYSAMASQVSVLTDAASPAARAFELVGMTSLVAGKDGSYILCRDPHSSRINVYNLDVDRWYAMDVASQGIVALQVRIHLYPVISNIMPSHIPMVRSSSVTVFGTDFGRADTSPRAYIGHTISQEVLWTSDSAIVVKAPSSLVKSAEVALKLDISGRQFLTGMGLNYVPSWHSVEPTEGSVTGGQTVTLRGGRFGAGPFRCSFGGLSTDGTPYGNNMVTCPVPTRPGAVAIVQVDLFSNGVLVNRDTGQTFSFVAGNAAQIAFLRLPVNAFGGRKFELVLALQDTFGNTILSYHGVLRLQISKWSDGEWSALPVVGNSILSVNGPYVQHAVKGVANFGIAIAGQGVYKLNFSTEACYCGEMGCTQDNSNWDGGHGGCKTYGAGQENDRRALDVPCIRDQACEPCACVCSGPCGFSIGGSELSEYGICTINSTGLSNFSSPRQMRAVASSCLANDTQIQVEIGQAATLKVTAPHRALSAHLLLPQPQVVILDSGGNLANVAEEIFVSVIGETQQVARSRGQRVNTWSGSAVNSSAGIAIFTDIKVFDVGNFSLVFSTGGGVSISVQIEVLHSSPTYLYNAGLYSSLRQVSMQAIQPAPVIWILDEGGNKISDIAYWTQDSHGNLTSRPLNVSIKAALSTVFQNVSNSIKLNPFGARAQPFSLPKEVSEPVGHFYGSTEITVLGKAAQLSVACPADCSGHGQCELDLCSCASGWRGIGCQLPDESISCGEDCDDSGIGYFKDSTCYCLPDSQVQLATALVGTEAAFTELLVDLQGKGFIITFMADGLIPVQSFAFAVVPGIARHLHVILHPMNGTGGERLFNAPEVEVRDAGKNLVALDSQGGRRNVSVHLEGNSDGILSGIQVRLSTEGRAVFGGLKVDRISGGVPYRLKFTSEGLVEAFSYSFNITPGSPHSLGIVQQPLGARGGMALALQPHLQLLDPGGNRIPISGDGWTVTAKLQNVSAYGTFNIPFVLGLARFTDLRIGTSDSMGQTYFTFDSGRNLQPLDSQPFNVTAGPPFIVHILTQPGNSSGVAFSRPPKIELLDGGGNPTYDSANISLSVKGALGNYYSATRLHHSNPVDAVVTCTGDCGCTNKGPSKPAASGKFWSGYEADTTNYEPGSICKWLIASTAPIAVSFEAFDTEEGYDYVYINLCTNSSCDPFVDPDDPDLHGPYRNCNLFPPPCQLAVLNGSESDALDSKYTSSTGYLQVVFTFNGSAERAGFNASWRTEHTNTLILTDSFFDITAPAPNWYQLAFSLVEGQEYLSEGFFHDVGKPFGLEVQVHPSMSNSAGEAFLTQPVVQVVDAGGNLVPIDNINISVSFTPYANVTAASKYENPFVSDILINSSRDTGCDMSESAHYVRGRVTVPTLKGITSFTDLNVGLAGKGFGLNFSSSFQSIFLQSVVSQAFEVRLGLYPHSLRVLCQPQSEIAGLKFVHQPILQVVDLGGNRMHGKVVEATVWLLSPTLAFLSGNKTSKTRGDLITFTDLALDIVGNDFRLLFEAPGLQKAVSIPFAIVSGGPVALTVDLLKAIRAFETFNVTVSLRDSGGNLASPNQSAPIINISAKLYTLESRYVTLPCRGLHSCDADLNLTLPSGSALFSASISLTLSCTDFDSVNEGISRISVGSYELDAGVEYDSGPWPGCFRNCLDSRPVILHYDAVRDFCWDSMNFSCSRVLYNSGWNGAENRWDFLSRLMDQKTSTLPLHIDVPDTVNFNPCDGHFVNGTINVHMQYRVPDASGLLIGQKQRSVTYHEKEAAGSIVFDDFLIERPGQKFVLVFFADGLKETVSNSFSLSPGQVKRLRIVQQPGGATGGTVFSTQPTVELLDFGDNLVLHASGASYTVNASVMAPCAAIPKMPMGTRLLGNTSIHSTKGLAVFTDLHLDKVYDQYVMVFKLAVDDSSLADRGVSRTPEDQFFIGHYMDNSSLCFECYCSVNESMTNPCVSCAGPAEPAVMIASNLFSVALGLPYRLEIQIQPGDGKGAEALQQQPEIKVMDIGGNFKSDLSGTLISADIESNGAITGKLLGNVSAEVIKGTASFKNLAIDKTGGFYSFVFRSPNLIGVSSAYFNVVAGIAYRLAMIREPSDGRRDLVFSTQPAVSIQDRAGNKVMGWPEIVYVTLSGGVAFHPKLDTGNTSGRVPHLLGTLAGYNYRGAVYWHNLKIDKVGKDYALHFTTSGLLNCTSRLFRVSGHAASFLQFLDDPHMARSLSNLPVMQVAALDASGDPDAFFAPQQGDSVSINIASSPESTAELVQYKMSPFINGISTLTNTIVLTTSIEIVRLNLTYRNDNFESRDITLIEPFTGWWNLSYAGKKMQMSMKGQYLFGIVKGIFSDNMNEDQKSFISDHVPVFEKREIEHCLYFISTVSSVNSDGFSEGKEGSMYLQQCSSDTLITGHISTRSSQFNSPDTAWARDIQFFMIEEEPYNVSHYYVLVTNGFNSTTSTYAENSAMYKWQDGKLHLYQELTNTKSAYSTRYFKMGNFHYIIIANHFDSEGSGYAAPSVLYRYTWVTDQYKFVPVQSISTEGAVAWEYFESNGKSYMVVANFFNGSHFAINSTIYYVAPDIRIQQQQTIATNGARDVSLVSIGSTCYVAFANWQGKTVDIYKSNTLVPHFSLSQSLAVGAATGVEFFSISDNAYLAVSISDQNTTRVLPNALQIYRLDVQMLFQPFQMIALPSVQKLRYFSDGLDFLLSLVEVNEGGNMDARTQIYRWSGTLFGRFLSLPTRNASAVAIMDIPCNLTGGSRNTGDCSESNKQRLIMAVNGKNRGSEIFNLSRLESSPVATHIRFVDYNGTKNPTLNQTLLPSPDSDALTPPMLSLQADVYFFKERVTCTWRLPIQVDLQVWSQDAPIGTPYQMRVPASGVTNALIDKQGSAYFPSVRTTYSGVISLHAFNLYLNDLSRSFSSRITIVAGMACKLMLHDAPVQVISADYFTPLIAIHDIFGNFKKDADVYKVEATLRTNSTSVLVYNTIVSTKGAIARFGIQLFGLEQGLQVEFSASELEGVVSPEFDLIGRAYISELGSLPIYPGASMVNCQEGGVILFGGMLPDGTSSNMLSKVETRLPFQVTPMLAAGKIPPARVHHAALNSYIDSESMLVLGGQNNKGVFFNDVYSLNIKLRSWTHFSRVSFSPRAQHSVVEANLISILSDSPSPEQEISLVVVFGGRDASGKALNDLFLLNVKPTTVENSLNPPIESGDKPSARFGALMVWNNNKGYLMGGQNTSDDAVYCFDITYQGQYFRVKWYVMQMHAGLTSFHALAGPLLFSERVLILTRPNENEYTPSRNTSNAEIYALNPLTGQWLPTLMSPNTVRADYYALAEISKGRAIIFASNFARISTNAYLISLESSVALEIQNTPSQVVAGVVIFPALSVRVVDANRNIPKDRSRSSDVRVYVYDSYENQIPLHGETQVQAVNGIAAFNQISIKSAQAKSSGLHFVFESDSIQGISSTSFEVLQGPMARISIVQAPGGIFRGAAFQVQPIAELQDWAGKRVVDNSISMVIASLQYKENQSHSWADKTIWLLGQKSQRAVAGQVFFQNLGISRGAQEGYYKFVLAVGGFIIPGTVTFSNISSVQLETTAFLSMQPLACSNVTIGLSEQCRSYLDYAKSLNAIIAGVPLLVQPSVIVQVSGASSLFVTEQGYFFDVTFSPDLNGTNLNGTKSAELLQGRLNFTDISINPSGSGFRFIFSSPLFPIAETAKFFVVPGTPASMTIQLTVDRAFAGLAFQQQPVISVSDMAKNIIVLPVAITATLRLQGKEKDFLKGNQVATTVLGTGTAFFTDLTVDPVDTGYSIDFVLHDTCCDARLDLQSPPFNVTLSGQASLVEISHSAGAITGTPFASQPSVAIQDFGGNGLSVNGTFVTASIGRGPTVRTAPPKNILESRNIVSKVLHYSVNTSEYVLVANFFDGTTYNLNSTLYIFDGAALELRELQNISTEGAQHLSHFVQDEKHYVIVANRYKVVTIVAGVIQGTYNTLSNMYQVDDSSGRLKFVASIPTKGATAIEPMQIAGKTMILVANSYDDNTSVVNSALFRFNPDGNSSHPHIVKVQDIPADSASGFLYFRGSQGQDIVLAATYFDSRAFSYLSKSVVHRLREGRLEVEGTISTSGAVAIKVFYSGSRKYVVVGNGFGLNNTAEPGVVVLYEHNQGTLVVRQQLDGFVGLSDIEMFHFNGAEWLVVTTDPLLVGSTSPGSLSIFTWDTSSCAAQSTPCNNSVTFSPYRKLECIRCGKSTYFESAGDRHHLLYSSAAGLSILSFYSDVALSGNVVAESVNGIARFTDLFVGMVINNISLSYRSMNLQRAYGRLFSVDYSQISTIRVHVRPYSGFAAVAFTVQPVVQLLDVGGNILPYQHDGNNISVSISASGVEAAFLTGSTVALIQHGTATFTNLGISALTSVYVLNFTYSTPSDAVLFDSFDVTILTGKPNRIKFRVSADELYAGMVFGQQPVIALYDAGGNFVSNGSTRIGVTINSHQGFDMLPFTDSSTVADLIPTGMNFFSYLDLGYVIVFGRIVFDNMPTMKMYRFGCNSLILVQTWDASVVHVSFWNQENTTWMVRVGSDFSCIMYAFDSVHERFVARGYFMLPGVFQLLPIQLADKLHLVAAINSSYGAGSSCVVLLLPSEISADGNWSMSALQNWTIQIQVLQNFTSVASVAALKGFHYAYKDWLVVLENAKISLFRWGEYLDQYFHLHDSKSIGFPVVDMTMYFGTPLQPPTIAVAGQQLLFINLRDDSFPRGISLQSPPVTYEIDVRRVAHIRKGNLDLIAVVSSSQVSVLTGNNTLNMSISWSLNSSMCDHVLWGWSQSSTYIFTACSGTPVHVRKLKDRGELSGNTLVLSNKGLASFKDLQIDLIGSYTLTFSAVGLQNDFFYPEFFDSRGLTSVLTVQIGNPSALVVASIASYGTTPSVRLVDSGGNDIKVGAAKARITNSTNISDFKISGSDSTSIPPLFMNRSCMLACQALFPSLGSAPKDGMLWHFGEGAGTFGAWLGIRDSAASPVLRLRIGLGDAIISGQPSPNILYLDINDFPKDGRLHAVVAELSLNTTSLWLKLFIDGELKGWVGSKEVLQVYSNFVSQWTSGGVYSYGINASNGQIPVGEPNFDWPGITRQQGEITGISSRLTFYEGTDGDPFCDRSHLIGDWASGDPWDAILNETWDEILNETFPRSKSRPRWDETLNATFPRLNTLQYICCELYDGCPKVTAVLDSPRVMNSIEHVQTIFSSVVRDVEHFTIGSQHYVALANSFDGERYLVDSMVYSWNSSRRSFQAMQALTTKGAYDFEFFTIHQTNVSRAGPGVTAAECFLAVANHFDDISISYSTQSTIYKWNAASSEFQTYQKIFTLGATTWESFTVDGVAHLVVSNFFDGTYHSVDSEIYRWSAGFRNFTLFQRIPTVGAHSVLHYKYAGEIFLFFAEYRGIDDVSLATQSSVYMWDARSAQFKLATKIKSSAAMRVEPFDIGGSLYLAVANYANSTTGNLMTNSTILKFSCSQGVYQTSELQSIPTYGAVYVKHFTRGGVHYLAVSNWKLGTDKSSCDGTTATSTPGEDCPSTVIIYLWNGISFENYTEMTTTPSGVFSLDVMLLDSRYYLLSTMVDDDGSKLKRFGAVSSPYKESSTGFLWDGPLTFPEFNAYLPRQRNASAPTNAQETWGIEFVSLPLTGAQTGAYN